MWPGASNVIPGRVSFSADVRCKGDDFRDRLVDELVQRIQGICEWRQIRCNVSIPHYSPTVYSDAGVTQLLSASVQRAQAWWQELAAVQAACGDSHGEAPEQGESSASGDADTAAADARAEATCAWDTEAAEVALLEGVPTEVPVMVSGAGHDAMAMADVAKVGMIFVRNKAGLSHSPQEHVYSKDVAMGAAALLEYIKTRALPGPTEAELSGQQAPAPAPAPAPAAPPAAQQETGQPRDQTEL